METDSVVVPELDEVAKYLTDVALDSIKAAAMATHFENEPYLYKKQDYIIKELIRHLQEYLYARIP